MNLVISPLSYGQLTQILMIEMIKIFVINVKYFLKTRFFVEVGFSSPQTRARGGLNFLLEAGEQFIS